MEEAAFELKMPSAANTRAAGRLCATMRVISPMIVREAREANLEPRTDSERVTAKAHGKEAVRLNSYYAVLYRAGKEWEAGTMPDYLSKCTDAASCSFLSMIVCKRDGEYIHSWAHHAGMWMRIGIREEVFFNEAREWVREAVVLYTHEELIRIKLERAARAAERAERFGWTLD